MGNTFMFGEVDSAQTPNSAWPTAFAVCGMQPSNIYMALHKGTSATSDTSSVHIELSTDRGLTWTHKNVIDPFVAAGINFNRVLKMVCKPNDPTIVYLLTGTEKLSDTRLRPAASRLFKSIDSGNSWTDISPVISATTGVIDFAIHPFMPETLFAAEYQETFANFGGLIGATYISLNAGTSWTSLVARTGSIVCAPRSSGQKRTDGEQDRTIQPNLYIMDMARDYTPGTAVDCGVFKAVAPWTSWNQINDSSTWDQGWNYMEKAAYSASIRGVANSIYLSNADSMSWIAVTSQYAWRGDTLGNFTSIFSRERRYVSAGRNFNSTRGIDDTDPVGLSVARGIIASGWYDLGIGISRDGGNSWQMSNDSTKTGTWAGHGGDCSAILIDPTLPSTVWAAQGAGKLTGTLIRSTTYGSPGSWAAVTGFLASGFISSIALDPSSTVGTRVMYAVANGDLYRSADDGVNWALQWDTTDSLRTVAVRGDTVYMGTRNRIYKNPVGANIPTGNAVMTVASWAPNAIGTISDYKFRGAHKVYVRREGVFAVINGAGLFIDPAGDAVADSFGVYVSTNQGTAWSRIHTGKYDEDFTISPNGWYWVTSRNVGTGGGLQQSVSNGIWLSKNKGVTWANVTANLPWPQVHAVAFDPDGKFVVINVFGVGVFKTPLESFVTHNRWRKVK
jgi:hypothetical protein